MLWNNSVYRLVKSVASRRHHLNDSHIMAPTFGTLAALILLFAAFVANKNKEAIEETNSVIASEDKKYARQTETFNGLVSDIDGLVADKEDADAAREAKQIDLDKQLAENKATEAELASKKAEAASIEEQVASAEDKLKTVGDPRDLAPRLRPSKWLLPEWKTMSLSSTLRFPNFSVIRRQPIARLPN